MLLIKLRQLASCKVKGMSEDPVWLIVMAVAVNVPLCCCIEPSCTFLAFKTEFLDMSPLNFIKKVFLSTLFALSLALFFAPVGARCGDSSWKNPLYGEGGSQGGQTSHPHLP